MKTNNQYSLAASRRAFFTLLLGAGLAAGVLPAHAQTCAPPPAGLVSWYQAEGNTTDFTGTNNGSPNGAITYSAGEVGQAFQFDGASSVEVPDSPSLDFTNALTIEGWVNPATTGASGASIMTKGRLDTTNGYPYTITYTNQILSFGLGNGSTNAGLSAANAIPLNTYTHFAATYNGTTMSLYINGVLSASQTTTVGTLFNEDILGLSIGSASGFSFVGAIDEISLYNRPLSPAEIAAIFNAGSAGKCTSESTLELTAAVSRKTHGASGDFDLPLVLSPTGSGTVEPRANGPTTVVFAFSDNIAAADGTISANEFTVTNATFSNASILGSTLTLDLTGVIDQSVVSVTLTGINDTGSNPLTGDNDVEIRALVGDADQNRTVTRGDLRAVAPHAGEPLEQMSGNYLFDLNLDGVISQPDAPLVRMNRNHTVP